ncbi:porin [Pantoea sp. 18069]|uniref:porin n=1 Tax=Pantoea sp. 18069 TaxID=2681415 RepID=UPI00135B1C99|nr:porin [Pantoea sp. 18069]
MKTGYIGFSVFLGLFSAAHAQSNVTLYGTLDIGIAKTFNDPAVSVRSSKFPSNWGIRGSEDLGGGLKANFHLESNILSLDTGEMVGGSGFTRQSWVGLSGNFGELMLGRTTTPQARLMATFDLNGISDVNPWSTLGVAANGSLGGARHSNQVQYGTPNLSGFQARASYSFDETSTNDVGARDGNFQIGAGYGSKQWTAAAVLMPKKRAGRLNAVPESSYQNGFVAGLKYDQGSFVVSGLFQRDEQKLLGDSVGVAVAAPFGALTVGAQYALVTRSTDAQYKDANVFELFANYALSKRTLLYVIAAGANRDAQRARKLRHKDSLSAGVLHRF